MPFNFAMDIGTTMPATTRVPPLGESGTSLLAASGFDLVAALQLWRLLLVRCLVAAFPFLRFF